MAEKIHEKTDMPQPSTITSQQQQTLAIAQAVNALNIRMTNVEIEIHKTTANIDILNKTIELVEKRLNFNERKT